jgi:hypothetical protein
MNNSTHPQYKALDFIVTKGGILPGLVALGVLLISALLWLDGASVIVPVVGVLVAAFLYLIMRSYVELVRVIVDMLLPK